MLLAGSHAAGIIFAVLATAVLHLHVAGDVPSRLVVFAASSISVVLAGLQAITLCLAPETLSFVCVLLARISIVAWIAAIALTSLVVAQTVHVTAVSSTLAAQAIYLNLLISGMAFIATGILSFCLERNVRRVKEQDSIEEGEDDDSILNRSVSQRGSLTSLAKGKGADSTKEAVDDPVVEPRPKKLLFSYKATTQLIEEPGSWRTSMAFVSMDKSVSGPPEPAMAVGSTRPASSIKRKPVHSTIRPRAPALSTDRRKSMIPTAWVSTTAQSAVPAAMFPDPFADPVEDPFADSNRIVPDRKTMATTSTSRRLSKMPTQPLPKLITTVAPVADASTFYLSSSGSSNYDDEEERKSVKEPSRVSTLPYSPAVTRPLSIVPPVPQVPVPQIPVSQMPVSQALAPTKAIPRRKPVGGAVTAAPVTPAASTTVSPIKRKPVPSMLVHTQTVVASAAKSEPTEPLSPMSQPVIPSIPVKFSSVSSAATTISSPTTRSSMHFSSFSSAVSSRKSSNASTASEESVASSSYSTLSLADMVASSLRRVSVIPGSSEGSGGVDVSTAVSKAFAAAGAAPPLTRSVAYSQPRVLDQPIVRKSFIATTGSGNSNGNINGSASNSRRPSEVSIMETIYSPAEGDDEQEKSEKDDDEDADLAAMVRQEAEAAAAAADAGRRWLEPSRESIQAPPSRTDRTLSVSKPLSKRPYLSPVEEKEQEQSEEEIEGVDEIEDSSSSEEKEESTVHTIVVHEPAAGFTATGLSRTASRMRKAALQATGQTAAGAMASPYTPAYVPAYTRRRLSTAASYNFSRPMREGVTPKRASVVSTATATTSPSKRASLVIPALPQTSLLVSPRSRVRRQLLQMLPVQHRPILLVKTKQPVVSVRKQSLSGRRRRRSLSLDLSQTSSGSGSDSEGSSTSSASSSTGRRSPSRRSASLARTAQRARRRNHGRHLAGLRSSTLRPVSGGERLSPHTPHNRPISPMTVLMERAR
ncbi:hypothetical protein SEUCBS139899_001880 [Sporothrix eucalyptigena]